jgi:hypothetical protein
LCDAVPLGVIASTGQVEREMENLDIVLVILFFVGWFVLMRFILPRLGVST